MGKRSEWIIDKTEAVSPDGMVAAMQPLAAGVGAEILRRGGNAIDAAVATAFAIGVVEPFMSGVGGVAFLVYREAATGKTICLDGSTVLPAAIRPEMFELLPSGQRSGLYGWRATKDDAANTGWLSPGVPGTPALLQDAHRRFGRLPWRDLVAPAIRLAADGFEVNHYIAMMTSASAARLWRFPESKRTFFKPGGIPLTPSLGAGPGDKLVLSDLARTLRLIAEEGADTVYRGEVARLIAEDMARNGGLITEADLAAHRTQVFEPEQVGYREYQILGQLENSGYATVAEAAQILEGFDLAGMGFQSVEAEHVIVEAMRRAFLDRLRYLGDASLMAVPYKGVIAREYAAERRATVDLARATPDVGPGDPWPFDPSRRVAAPMRSGAGGEGQTTHMTVIDRDHNMASLTSTLGAGFGSAVVIKGTGITLNNATMWFDPEPGAVTSIGPGKRLMSAAANVLVLRDGKPFLAIGSPGGRRVITAVLQCILNAADFGLGMQAAISAPRVHCEGRVASISNRFPPAVAEGLRRLGHELVVNEDNLSTNFFARPNGVMIDPVTGDLRGGVFQYTPATAVGV
ncbi:MAG: gamma-glutamyltransferase [Chloroflexi bacterium]|nr:gamma-glutamyltransferase [Chloroflexota bacterium]